MQRAAVKCHEHHPLCAELVQAPAGFHDQRASVGIRGGARSRARRMLYLACLMCLIMAASVTARGGGPARLQRVDAELCRWTFWVILTYGLG